MAKRKAMPNKIGRVGRKKISESDKKIRIDTWKSMGQVDQLGGKSAVMALFSEFFDNKITTLKTLQSVDYND